MGRRSLLQFSADLRGSISTIHDFHDLQQCCRREFALTYVVHRPPRQVTARPIAYDITVTSQVLIAYFACARLERKKEINAVQFI